MSYTYLLEQGEESSAASFLDIPQSVLSRLNLIAGKSCCKGSGTESCQSFQSGMMSPPSTELRGGEKLMSSAEDSRAKTSQLLGGGLELKANEAGFGQKWPESLAKYDPNSRSWRTAQCLLFEDLGESLETFPNWGMMRGGECWAQTILEQGIKGRGFGLLGTPLARMWKNRKWWNRSKPMSNLDELPATNPEMYGHLAGKQMSLTWLEHHMIFPLGWTDLVPLGIHKFQEWLRSHSEFLEVEND